MSNQTTLLEEEGYRVIMHHVKRVCSLEMQDGKDQKGDTRGQDRHLFETDQIDPPGALQPEGDGCLHPSKVFVLLCEALCKERNIVKNLRDQLEKMALENKSLLEMEEKRLLEEARDAKEVTAPLDNLL